MSGVLKNILVIDNSNFITGSIQSSLQVTCQLKQKYRFIYVLPGKSTMCEVVEKHGFEVIRLPMLEISKRPKALAYLPVLLKNTFRLLRVIRDENIDIVHVNDLYNMLGITIRIFSPGTRLIYCIRLLRNSYIKPLYPFFSSLINKFADRIVCVSSAVQRDIGTPGNSLVIYTSAPEQKSPDWGGLKEPEALKILYPGNYISGKGQDWAILALQLVIQKYPEVSLTFVGGCSGGPDQSYKSRLISRAKDFGIDENIIFSGPTIDMEQAMKSNDLVLNLSESESFSMICLEALSYGVPLITSDCGGPSEICREGRYAHLAPNKDHSAAARAILHVIEHPDQSRRAADAGKQYVRERFSAQIELDAWEDVYGN